MATAATKQVFCMLDSNLEDCALIYQKYMPKEEFMASMSELHDHAWSGTKREVWNEEKKVVRGTKLTKADLCMNRWGRIVLKNRSETQKANPNSWIQACSAARGEMKQKYPGNNWMKLRGNLELCKKARMIHGRAAE